MSITRPMRRFKQELPREDCVRLMQTEKRGVLSVIGDGGYPYGIPLDFYYDAAEDAIYFHCAKVGHKIDAIRACDKVCFTVCEQGVQKEDWSYHVRSVICFGRAELVEDAVRTCEKARQIGLKYYPDAESVEEELHKDVHRVQIVAIHIEHMTGKLVHEK